LRGATSYRNVSFHKSDTPIKATESNVEIKINKYHRNFMVHKSTGVHGNIFSQTRMRMVIIGGDYALGRDARRERRECRNTKKLNGVEEGGEERERERDASGVVHGRY